MQFTLDVAVVEVWTVGWSGVFADDPVAVSAAKEIPGRSVAPRYVHSVISGNERAST